MEHSFEEELSPMSNNCCSKSSQVSVAGDAQRQAFKVPSILADYVGGAVMLPVGKEGNYYSYFTFPCVKSTNSQWYSPLTGKEPITFNVKMDLCESVNHYHLTHVPQQYLCSLITRIFHLQ